MEVWVLHWQSTTKPESGVIRVYSDMRSANDALELMDELKPDDRDFYLDKFEVKDQ